MGFRDQGRLNSARIGLVQDWLPCSCKLIYWQLFRATLVSLSLLGQCLRPRPLDKVLQDVCVEFRLPLWRFRLLGMTAQQQAMARLALACRRQLFILVFSIFANPCRGDVHVDKKDSLYPWAHTFLSETSKHKHKLRAAFSRGCPSNGSTLPDGFTYVSFAWLVSQEKNLWQWKWDEKTVNSLTSRQQLTNRHLLICPLAVWRALQLICYHHVHVAAKSLTSEESWSRSWHEIRHASKIVNSIDELFQCRECTQDMRQSIYAAAMHDGWRVNGNWLARALADRMQSFMEEPQDQVFRWTGNFTSTEHFNLMRDGKALFEYAREEKLLRSWVVTHGTLITLMRYGQSRGRRLHSGQSFLDDNFDMDVMVVTDDWAAFAGAISQNAENFGFNWCGWMSGWAVETMFCWRGQGEIEITNANKHADGDTKTHHHLDLSINPPTRCRVEHPSSQTWPKLDDASPEWLELPCPRDPMALMNHLWSHRYHFMRCFALPISRYDEAVSLTKEDVDELWNRSLELQASGFANMAWYFGDCHDHPLSDYAKDLYWGRA